MLRTTGFTGTFICHGLFLFTCLFSAITSATDEGLVHVKAHDTKLQVFPSACKWQCYLDRYVDLQNDDSITNEAEAENHYNEYGKQEGRDCTCMDIQALQACDWQCYLNRYADLQIKFGATNVSEAERHYKEHGEKEYRDCTCPMPAYKWTYTETCPSGYRMLTSDECRTYGIQSVFEDGDDCNWGEAESSSTNNFRQEAPVEWGARPTGCWTEERPGHGKNSHCLYWSPKDGRDISYSEAHDRKKPRSICIKAAHYDFVGPGWCQGEDGNQASLCRTEGDAHQASVSPQNQETCKQFRSEGRSIRATRFDEAWALCDAEPACAGFTYGGSSTNTYWTNQIRLSGEVASFGAEAGLMCWRKAR